jgi:hypothetical protein
MNIKLYHQKSTPIVKIGNDAYLVEFTAELTKQQYDALIGATSKHAVHVDFEEQ